MHAALLLFLSLLFTPTLPFTSTPLSSSFPPTRPSNRLNSAKVSVELYASLSHRIASLTAPKSTSSSSSPLPFLHSAPSLTQYTAAHNFFRHTLSHEAQNLTTSRSGFVKLHELLLPSSPAERTQLLSLVDLGLCTGTADPDPPTAPAAKALLSSLSLKQSRTTAFNLLVSLNIWSQHEPLNLLRSTLPVRYPPSYELGGEGGENVLDEDGARVAPADPDSLLGIRRDLRQLKTYTIDSISANEIDDALSLEVIPTSDGSIRQRIWIHIADVEHYAKRSDTSLLEQAAARGTSVYLPSHTVSMFPGYLSSMMSLRARRDSKSLSLCCEIGSDGELLKDTVQVMASNVMVMYRLTYDEVDEMLAEGVGYAEEWQLGSLLSLAKKRRAYRIRNGSQEGLVKRPIPSGQISVKPDRFSDLGYQLTLSIQNSHNAGVNESSTTAAAGVPPIGDPPPASNAWLLVTEMMILAGEAMASYAGRLDPPLPLPHRTQPLPSYKSNPARASQHTTLLDLQETNVGNGLCAAWAARRFFEPVLVTTTPAPHAGLGLKHYVQWTSPIRRFSDLQVHTQMKQALRRKKVLEMVTAGKKLPEDIASRDAGLQFTGVEDDKVAPVDFDRGTLGTNVARKVQREAQHYWMLVYIATLQRGTKFDAVVLGKVSNRSQIGDDNMHVIYIEQLGLESMYNGGGVDYDLGCDFRVVVKEVDARRGILTFAEVSR